MCAPAALLAASLVVSAVATGASYYAQDQASKGQNKYNQETAKEGSRLAREDFELKIQAEQERQRQESQEAAVATQESQREHAIAKSKVVVSAGEANVSGLSVDALLQDFDRLEAAERFTIEENRRFGRGQSDLRQRSYRAQANQNLAGLRTQGVRRPSMLGLGLSLAGTGLSTANQYSRL